MLQVGARLVEVHLALVGVRDVTRFLADDDGDGIGGLCDTQR